MTFEEFDTMFRGVMLLAAAEGLAMRQCDRKEVGAAMERHALQMRRLRREMYDALAPKHENPTNGHANGVAATPKRN